VEQVDKLAAQAVEEIREAAGLADLDQLRVRYLGKKGVLTALLKELGRLPPEERPKAGQQVNDAKQQLSVLIEQRQAELAQAEVARKLREERVDVSLPGRRPLIGGLHPISQTIDEIIAIFAEMGFSVAEGPDIEDDWHNFTALNIPPEHPARQEMDTFYLPGEKDGAGWCCAPTPRRCRSAQCCAIRRRCASSRPGGPIDAIPMPPTRRCSIRWRGCSRTWASTPSVSPGLPSASVSSGWPCCVSGSMTCGCF
jgi:phenylalanyl-tRNA synthetase alpha subunit